MCSPRWLVCARSRDGKAYKLTIGSNPMRVIRGWDWGLRCALGPPALQMKTKCKRGRKSQRLELCSWKSSHPFCPAPSSPERPPAAPPAHTEKELQNKRGGDYTDGRARLSFHPFLLAPSSSEPRATPRREFCWKRGEKVGESGKLYLDAECAARGHCGSARAAAALH